MADPYDYTSAFANLPSPVASFTQGIVGGVALNQIQQQQQQQRLALAQQKQQQADLAALSKNPTPEAIGATILKYPALSEQIKRGSDVISAAQQQARIKQAIPIYAAIQSGSNDVAVNLLSDQATAARNSGNEQDAKAAETMAQLVKDHPEFARATIGLKLASELGPGKFTEAFKGLGAEQRAQEKAPVELATKQIEATQKGLGIIGQKAGALAQVKGVQPGQVATLFKSLAAQGVIPKDQLQGYLDDIPQNPKALPDYLTQIQSSGVKPEEQLKFTTPTAGEKLASQTQLQVQRLIDARQGDTTETQFTKELSKLYKPGSPEYDEALRQRINKEAGINAAGGGGRSVVYNGRIIASGNEVARALKNITDLPVQSNVGVLGFGQPKSTGLFSAGLAGLKNELNSDQVKDYNTLWTGVSRNLGTLETSGLATTGDLIKSIDKLAFVPGDNGYNALRKLAEVRQITEAALEPKLADPSVPQQQKDFINGIINNVQQAVPYNHSDLTKFKKAQKDNPSLTFNDFAGQTLKAQAAPAAALPAGWSVQVH